MSGDWWNMGPRELEAYGEQPEDAPEPRGAAYGSARCPGGGWFADEVTGEIVDCAPIAVDGPPTAPVPAVTSAELVWGSR